MLNMTGKYINLIRPQLQIHQIKILMKKKFFSHGDLLEQITSHQKDTFLKYKVPSKCLITQYHHPDLLPLISLYDQITFRKCLGMENINCLFVCF